MPAMMRFVKKFRKKKGTTKTQDEQEDTSTATERQDTVIRVAQSAQQISPQQQKHRNNAARLSPPSEKLSNDERNNSIAIVKAFYRAHAAARVGPSLSSIASKNCLVEFIDEGEKIEIPISQFVDTIASLWSSFPDFEISIGQLTCSTVDGDNKEVDDKTSTYMVVVENARASGTHTGAPYAFGPYIPVPTSGKRVEEPLGTTVQVFVRDGKVCHVRPQENPRKSGRQGGPGYFYTSIGGEIF